MIEVKNQFANHLIFWSLVLPFVAVLVLPAFMASNNFAISEPEIAFFKNVLNQDTEQITATCDSVFNSAFVETKIATAFRDFFAPRAARNGPESGLMSLSSNFSRNYNNSLWLMVYRGIWRITGLWPIVLSLFLAIGLPCLVDGLAVRARKSYNFQFHNPVFFWSASHSVIIVIGLGIFLPFLPYALSPVVMVCFFVAFCACLWVTASNFQTGN